MLKRFYPKLNCPSIFDIEYDKLKEANLTNLVFDIDNTLVPFDIKTPTKEIINLFENLTSRGFKICLLSNNSDERVRIFIENFAYPAIARAKKPTSQGIKKAMNILNSTNENTVLIGDQMFTDVWCGNRNNMYTILVTPVATRDEFTVKLKRGIESLVYKAYIKSNR